MSDVSGGRTMRWTAALACTLMLLAAIATASVPRAHGARPQAAASARVGSASFGRLPLLYSARAARLVGQSQVLQAPIGLRGLQARVAGTPCGQTPGLVCSQVDVPLD